jgi:hypothetical protein
MKKVVSVAIVLVAVSFAKAQGYKPFNYKLDGPFAVTKTIKVKGIGEADKYYIENALKKSSAVFYANWDAGSKLLLVKYDRTKLNPEKIEDMVAAAARERQNVNAGVTANTQENRRSK